LHLAIQDRAANATAQQMLYQVQRIYRRVPYFLRHHPVRLAYQPPANSTFISEQTSHQQPASSTSLSEQNSTSH
jgi:hypothetical protein